MSERNVLEILGVVIENRKDEQKCIEKLKLMEKNVEEGKKGEEKKKVDESPKFMMAPEKSVVLFISEQDALNYSIESDLISKKDLLKKPLLSGSESAPDPTFHKLISELLIPQYEKWLSQVYPMSKKFTLKTVFFNVS